MASWVKATEECVRMLYRPGSESPDDVILHSVCVCVFVCGFVDVLGSRVEAASPISLRHTPKLCLGLRLRAKWGWAGRVQWKWGNGVSEGGAAGISCDQSNSFQKAESMYRELNHGCGWKKNAPVLWHLLTQLQTQPREMCHTIRSVRKSGL